MDFLHIPPISLSFVSVVVFIRAQVKGDTSNGEKMWDLFPAETEENQQTNDRLTRGTIKTQCEKVGGGKRENLERQSDSTLEG